MERQRIPTSWHSVIDVAYGALSIALIAYWLWVFASWIDRVNAALRVIEGR